MAPNGVQNNFSVYAEETAQSVFVGRAAAKFTFLETKRETNKQTEKVIKKNKIKTKHTLENVATALIQTWDWFLGPLLQRRLHIKCRPNTQLTK